MIQTTPATADTAPRETAAALTITITPLPNQPGTGGSAVCVLAGRLEAVQAAGLRTELTAAQQAGAASLIVDLHAVHFIDSAGLAALVRARKESRSAGGEVVLINPADRDVLRVFRLTQFDEVFRMVDARGAA
ncbi:STAS domain-containing protein [Nakamurella sp. GG22]